MARAVTRNRKSPQPTVAVRAGDIVTTGGIADRLGLPKSNRVTEWVANHDDFPLPLALLKTGRVYSWSQVDEWLRTTTSLLEPLPRVAVQPDSVDPDRIVLSTHLVGLREIAAMVGLERQSIKAWQNTYHDFPEPAVRVGLQRHCIWVRPDIDQWCNLHCDPITKRVSTRVHPTHPTRSDFDQCHRCGIALSAHRELTGNETIGDRRTCVDLLRLQAGLKIQKRGTGALPRWKCVIEMEVIFPSTDAADARERSERVVAGSRRLFVGHMPPGVKVKSWAVTDVRFKNVSPCEEEES